MRNPVPVPAPTAPPAVATSADAVAAGYRAAADAPATLLAYRADLACYRTWCAIEAHDALPATPQTVSAYLAALAPRYALATPEIRRLVAAYGGDLAGLRDRAMLLLAYAAALRRSELATVTIEDVCFTGNGLELLLPRAKTDAAVGGEPSFAEGRPPCRSRPMPTVAIRSRGSGTG